LRRGSGEEYTYFGATQFRYHSLQCRESRRSLCVKTSSIRLAFSTSACHGRTQTRPQHAPRQARVAYASLGKIHHQGSDVLTGGSCCWGGALNNRYSLTHSLHFLHIDTSSFRHNMARLRVRFSSGFSVVVGFITFLSVIDG